MLGRLRYVKHNSTVWIKSSYLKSIYSVTQARHSSLNQHKASQSSPDPDKKATSSPSLSFSIWFRLLHIFLGQTEARKNLETAGIGFKLNQINRVSGFGSDLLIGWSSPAATTISTWRTTTPSKMIPEMNFNFTGKNKSLTNFDEKFAFLLMLLFWFSLRSSHPLLLRLSFYAMVDSSALLDGPIPHFCVFQKLASTVEGVGGGANHSGHRLSRARALQAWKTMRKGWFDEAAGGLWLKSLKRTWNPWKLWNCQKVACDSLRLHIFLTTSTLLRIKANLAPYRTFTEFPESCPFLRPLILLGTEQGPSESKQQAHRTSC